MDIENYSKEEMEQIIRIQRRMIEEYHKANYDKPKKEINYEIIKDEEKKKEMSIHKLCELMGFPRRTYHRWKNNDGPSKPKYDEELLILINKVFNKHKGVYGTDRIWGVLKHRYNTPLNIKTVHRYLRKLGLSSRIRRTKKT